MDRDEKERILNRVLAEIEKERAPRKFYQIKRVVVIALAAVMVLACGAFTVKVLDLDDRLATLIGGKSDQIAQSVTDIHAATEKNGLRVEAKQAVGDGHRVFILIEITSLTDLTLDRSCNFEDMDVNYENEGTSGASIGVMEGQKISESSQGKHLNYLVTLTSEKASNTQEASIKLKNLSRILNVDKGQMRRLITGEWELEFSLKYKDVSQKYSTGKIVTTGKGAVKIDHVTISPISCFIEASVAEYHKEIESEWDQMRNIELKMKDGSSVPVLVDEGTWLDSGMDSSGTMSGTFGKLVDMDQVESIVIEGEKIQL